MDLSALITYFQIVAINLVLSADNVVVIGMAAASLPSDLRRKAIAAGILAATGIRIVLSLLATQLLAITGLLLLGGLLLFWVCWKMFEELRSGADPALVAGSAPADTTQKSLRQAILQIVVADVSMSLDNVLAVAGAAERNWVALIFGLLLSIALMGLAATAVAGILRRFRWIMWVGLIIVVGVAVRMVWDGTFQILATA